MTKKLLKNNPQLQTKSLAFKIIFSILSIAIITAIIIAANSRLSTPTGSAFESFPTHCRYEWVDQSGTKSADGKAHEVYANAGDTIPMYLTIRNRNIDPLALVMYGIPPQGTLLPEAAPHRGGHEFRIGVKDDEILSWIDPGSFYPNPDGHDNRFAVYDGPNANVGDELILTWNLKIKDDADGIYNLYTGIVREFDNWPWQVDFLGTVIPGGSDIFWKFIIAPSEDDPDPETELDRVDITDSTGTALYNLEIDEEDNKQLYAKAYSTTGDDITSNTDFTWSINSQYNPVDAGYITQTGLYTAGTTAEFYLGAIRLMGSYNNKTDSDAVSVTIGEVPPFGGDSELDRVEIVDNNGVSLSSFNIDQDIDKQLHVKAYDTSGNNITLDTEFTWSIDSQYSSTNVGTITSSGGLYTSGATPGSYTGAIRVSGLYNEISKLDTADVTINEDYQATGPEFDLVNIIPNEPIKGEYVFVHFKVSETEVGDGIEKVKITIPGINPVEIQCNSNAVCEGTQQFLMPMDPNNKGLYYAERYMETVTIALEATDSDEATTYETTVNSLAGVVVPTSGGSPPNELYDISTVGLYYDGIFNVSNLSYDEIRPGMTRYIFEFTSQGWKGEEWKHKGKLYVLTNGTNDAGRMIISNGTPAANEDFVKTMLDKYKIPVFAIEGLEPPPPPEPACDTGMPPRLTFTRGPYKDQYVKLDNCYEEISIMEFAGQKKEELKNYGVYTDWGGVYPITKTYIRAMVLMKNHPLIKSLNLNPTEFILGGGSKRVIAMWPTTAYVNDHQSQLGFKVKGFVGKGASFVDAVGIDYPQYLGMYGRKGDMWDNTGAATERERVANAPDLRYADPIYYIYKINNEGVHHVNAFGTSDPLGGVKNAPGSQGFPLLHVYDYITKLTSRQLFYAAGQPHGFKEARYFESIWNLVIQQTFFGRPKQELTQYVSESVVENPPGSGNLTLQIKITPPTGINNYMVEGARIYYVMEDDISGPGEHKKYVFEIRPDADYTYNSSAYTGYDTILDRDNVPCPVRDDLGTGYPNGPDLGSNPNCRGQMEQDGNGWVYKLSNNERDLLINGRKLVYYIELQDRYENMPAYRTSMAKVCYYLGAPNWFECGGPYDLDDTK